MSTTGLSDPPRSPSTQTLGFAYDDDGRITGATTSAIGSAPAVTLKYTYDANGNRTSLVGPDGTTSYGYDALSRLTSVSPSTEPGGASFKLGYTPDGYLTTVTRPDGIEDTLTYNGEELTSRTASSGAGPVASSKYGYTPSGLRSSSDETGSLATSSLTIRWMSSPKKLPKTAKRHTTIRSRW